MKCFIPYVDRESVRMLTYHGLHVQPYEYEEEPGILFDDNLLGTVCDILRLVLFKSPQAIDNNVLRYYINEDHSVNSQGFSGFLDEIKASFHRKGERKALKNTSSVNVLDFDPRPDVEILSWRGAYKLAFTSLAQKQLGDVLKIPIVFHDMDSRIALPVDDGKFHIWFWSNSRGTASSSPGQKAWGINVLIEEDGFPLSGRGVAILTDEGWPIAELMGNNLYILFRVNRRDDRSTRQIFAKILEAVALETITCPDELATLNREKLRKHQRRSRERFIRACRGRITQEIATLETAVSKGAQEVKVLQKKLRDCLRDCQENSQRLRLLQADETAHDTLYDEEYHATLDIDGVKYIEVDSDTIRIFTDTIYYFNSDSNQYHLMGEYEILLCTDGREPTPRWRNLTQLIDGANSNMHHPHISNNGSACLGNLSDAFPMLMGLYKFRDAAALAIDFLRSANLEDAYGKYIDKWPIASNAEVEASRQKTQEEKGNQCL